MGLQNWLKLEEGQQHTLCERDVTDNLQASAKNRSQVYSKTLGSKRERQDLDRVGDRQWCEGNVVECKEYEEKRNSRTAGCFDGMLGKRRAQCRDDYKGGEHAASRDEPERATTEPFCANCTTEGEECIPYLEGKVDASLCDGAGDADTLQDWGEVV